MGSNKFINQEIHMYYLVSVDCNGTVVHLTSSDWRVLRSAVYPVQWMGLMMVCCGMAIKRMGLSGVSARKMEALNVMLYVTF